jgi:hypothetical protein
MQKEGGKVHSSYKEYLRERKTPWVKPKVVLSYFEKSENNYYKGVNGYKNFVEKYELKNNEKKMLERIIIESEPEEHLERSILQPEKIESFKDTKTEPVPVSRPRVPEFITTATVAFVVLFSLSVRNINTSTAQTDIPVPVPTPQVSGIEDAKPKQDKKTLVIKISDGSESVNIREKPTTKSAVVGKTDDGDTFEFISEDSGWYQIRLDDSSTAFVSARYAELEEIENN